MKFPNIEAEIVALAEKPQFFEHGVIRQKYFPVDMDCLSFGQKGRRIKKKAPVFFFDKADDHRNLFAQSFEFLEERIFVWFDGHIWNEIAQIVAGEA